MPSWAAVGTTYARFRVSTDGNPGIGGWAADGEVEDYAVSIMPPARGSGIFSDQIVISTNLDAIHHAMPVDFDGDGDMDIIWAVYGPLPGDDGYNGNWLAADSYVYAYLQD